MKLDRLKKCFAMDLPKDEATVDEIEAGLKKVCLVKTKQYRSFLQHNFFFLLYDFVDSCEISHCCLAVSNFRTLSPRSFKF